MSERACLLLLSLLLPASGASVINWVTTNGDAGFSGGSEATNSPVTTDADAETIVGSFPSVTLNEGEVLVLTGSINVTGNSGAIPGNQIRWGLFDAPGTPSTGVGAGYVGVWAPSSNAAATIVSADGSTGNPFSGSATTAIVTENGTGSMAYGSTYDFLLSISRFDASQISVSGSLAESGGGAILNQWPETLAPASPANFTYDAVGILLGGTTNATQATFANVDVTLVPEPATVLLGLLGAAGLLRRRRS